MAEEFTTFDIETDPDELAQLAYTRLQEQIAGWQPSPGNFESLLIEALARQAAELRDVAAQVPPAIFRYYGANLIGLPPEDAAQATTTSTWTMIDDSGYTIPAGTLVGLRAAGDELVAFEVQEDIVVSPGDTVTDTGEVVLVAAEGGANGNNISANPEPIDALDYVTEMVNEGTTSGGADAELDEDYLDRLTNELTLLTRRPILPVDFETIARNKPGVARALAVDGYEPVGPSNDNERTISVAIVDETGQPMSAPVKSELAAELAAEREVNFEVYVIDPTYTEIDVDFTAVAYEGFDPDVVEAAAIAAVETYLSPANWGLPPFGDETTWVDETVVRRFELIDVLNRVEGLHYVTDVELVEGGGSLGTADVTLDGPASLTTAGVVTGAVTAP